MPFDNNGYKTIDSTSGQLERAVELKASAGGIKPGMAVLSMADYQAKVFDAFAGDPLTSTLTVEFLIAHKNKTEIKAGLDTEYDQGDLVYLKAYPASSEFIVRVKAQAEPIVCGDELMITPDGSFAKVGDSGVNGVGVVVALEAFDNSANDDHALIKVRK